VVNGIFYFYEFESLILRKRQNIQHFVNTTFSVKKLNQQKIDLNEFDHDHLHLLFGLINPVSDTECNVRVISWIIYYGHTHLLQDGPCSSDLFMKTSNRFIHWISA
jgi:hypothetical protein